jgi:hypothetical protein
MVVTRQKARIGMKEAHKEWLDAFNDQDIYQRDLPFQCLGRQECTARKEEESGSYACVIVAVQVRNKMFCLGQDQQDRPNRWIDCHAITSCCIYE